MKYLILSLSLIFSIQLNAQELRDLYQRGYSFLPDSTNIFINNPEIKWAAYYNDKYPFPNCKIDSFKSIYDYIINEKANGKIKSYDGNFNEVNKDYTQSKHLCTPDGTSIQDSFVRDSLKEIFFEQIFYLESHKLKTYTIIAAPCYKLKYNPYCDQYDFVIKSFCSLNKHYNTTFKKTDKIIHLKDTCLTHIDLLDRLEEITIKKTYGMNFATALWCDASKGFNEVIDLKYNKKIPAENILTYDSIPIPDFDSLGNQIGSHKAPPDSSYWFRFHFFPYADIYEDWYYDTTVDIFFCQITKVDLYFTSWGPQDSYYEKRFRIIFK